MPNADDYQDAARRFRAISEQIHREAEAHAAHSRSPSMGSGPVREVIDDSLVLVHGDLVIAGDELSRLAQVCDQRAAVCAEYRRAWIAYWMMGVFDRIGVPPPRRPAWWADP